MRRLLTSKYWKASPKLKDCELSGYGPVVTSDGGFCCENVSNSPKKGVDGDNHSSFTKWQASKDSHGDDTSREICKRCHTLKYKTIQKGKILEEETCKDSQVFNSFNLENGLKKLRTPKLATRASPAETLDPSSCSAPASPASLLSNHHHGRRADRTSMSQVKASFRAEQRYRGATFLLWRRLSFGLRPQRLPCSGVPLVSGCSDGPPSSLAVGVFVSTSLSTVAPRSSVASSSPMVSCSLMASRSTVVSGKGDVPSFVFILLIYGCFSFLML
ncbi:hypothetical protein K1719_022688 [Acacia pycnantha]|nr:hypothetical protein K1719_022688 [Acacia pycnantha]